MDDTQTICTNAKYDVYTMNSRDGRLHERISIAQREYFEMNQFPQHIRISLIWVKRYLVDWNCFETMYVEQMIEFPHHNHNIKRILRRNLAFIALLLNNCSEKIH